MVVLGYLAVSLGPFIPDPPHRVANGAVRDDTGIAFPRPGMVTQPALDALDPGDVPLRIDLELDGEDGQEGPARILTLSSGVYRQSLVIGQQGPDLVVRARRPDSSLRGTKGLVVDGVLGWPGRHHVTVVVDQRELTVDVDGRRYLTEPASGLDSWDPHHRLLLGNEHGGTRPWLGHLSWATMRIPGRTIDLLASGELPASYWVVPDRLHTIPPWYATWDIGPVTALHLVALVLLGWLAARTFPRRRAGVVLAGCWALSVVVLAGKFLMAGRHPTTGDLVAELVGAAIGVALARWWGPRPEPSPPTTHAASHPHPGG